MTVMRTLMAVAVIAFAPAASANETILPAAIVSSCQAALAGARQNGDERWLRECARRRSGNTMSESQAARSCRDWLASCRENPQRPLPRGTNSY